MAGSGNTVSVIVSVANTSEQGTGCANLTKQNKKRALHTAAVNCLSVESEICRAAPETLTMRPITGNSYSVC